MRALCLAGLEDPAAAVRAAFARALGQIAVASSSGEAVGGGTSRGDCGVYVCRGYCYCRGGPTQSPPLCCHLELHCPALPTDRLSDRLNGGPPTLPASAADAAQESARALDKKPKSRAAQERALSEVPTACLTTPFVEAASYSSRATCTALAQAWQAYLAASRANMEEQVGGRWGGNTKTHAHARPRASRSPAHHVPPPALPPLPTSRPTPTPAGVCGAGAACAGDAGRCLPCLGVLPRGRHRGRRGRAGHGHRQRRAPACTGTPSLCRSLQRIAELGCRSLLSSSSVRA